MRTLTPSWLDEPVAAGGAPDQPGFSLPVGTVTFLLTDVEDSTRQWEHAPAAMAAAIARHYELLDDAIVAHNGVRPVEQGEGDSVVGAFARASDALAAATDAQLRLHAEPWPDGVALAVRMAIHTGEAELRDEGNYFGPTVIRCARLRAIGAGGQVLVSGPTADLVGDRLPAGASLADLGLHRLKDLGRPEHVFELRHPDLPAVDAPLRSLDTLPNNLPVQLTSFVGRRVELAALRDLLPTTRLLSVNGAGGCGKTRLAVQLAADVVDCYPGGAWLAELATVVDPDACRTDDRRDARRARAQRRPRRGDRDPRRRPADAGRARQLRASARRGRAARRHDVAAVRIAHGDGDEPRAARCPRRNRVARAVDARARSRATPTRSTCSPSSTRCGSSSTGRRRPGRTSRSTPRTRPRSHRSATGSTASRSPSSSPPRACAGSPSSRSRPASTTASGCSPAGHAPCCPASRRCRHRSTGATSCCRSANAPCSAGSRCSRAASRSTRPSASWPATDIEPVEVLDLLVALVDKSMIDVDDVRSRYRMLESLRQYAAARLVEAGETAADARRAPRVGRGIDRPDRRRRQRRRSTPADAFTDEIDNLRAAFEWALLTGDADGATRCLAPLGSWEVSHGDPRAGIDVAVRALAMPGASHRLECLARASLAYAYAEAGEAERSCAAVDELAGTFSTISMTTPVRSACSPPASSLTFGWGFDRCISILEDALAAARRAGRSDADRLACSILALAHFVSRRVGARATHTPPRSSRTCGVDTVVGLVVRPRVRGMGPGSVRRDATTPRRAAPGPKPALRGDASSFFRLELDLAQGTDSGAAERLGALIADARRRGFTERRRAARLGPRRLAHGPRRGRRRRARGVAWHDETQSAWGTNIVVALLTLGRLAEARDQLETQTRRSRAPSTTRSARPSTPC